MDLEKLQGDPQFRLWLERVIEDRVREEFDREKQRHFHESFALISIQAKDPLALDIARHLGKPLTRLDLVEFVDGERKPVIHENLSGKNVYVVSTVGDGEDPDVSLANTLKVVSTLHRTCKVKEINLVVPCLWYQAQDKTHARREPITVRDVADDFLRRGMKHIIVMALHSEQIEIAFDSFDHLKTEPIFADYIGRRFAAAGDPLVLISPDEGGVRMREDVFRNMKPEWVAGVAAVHQLRVRQSRDEKEVFDFVGDVSGQVAVIIDDMMRSGTTMFQAAAAAKKEGAKKVIGVVTHFYGSESVGGERFEKRFGESALDEIVCANTRHGLLEKVRESDVFRDRITVLDISPYLAQAIRNYQTGGTVKDMIRTVSDLRELYRVVHGPDIER